MPRDIYDMEKDMSYYERAQAREDQLKMESEIRERIRLEEERNKVAAGTVRI